MMENYGRLSLVKNDGKDILVSGTGLESAGFGAGNFISQASVSLRESKGQLNANIADANSKGFDFGEKFSGEENIDKLKVTAYAGKGEVLTHITWNDYRIKLEYLFACNDQKAKFYNATEGGARINFTEELSFKECCEKLLTKEKPKFELPKSLTKNRSDKLLVKFKEKIQKDQENAKRFLDDALALKQILENILSKDFLLPLEFLEKVYQNIENFNQIRPRLKQ